MGKISSKDNNFVPTLIAVLNTSGLVPTAIKGSTTNYLKVDDGNTGSDIGPKDALKDANDISTLLAISSVDGVTPVAIYGDSAGHLFIDST